MEMPKVDESLLDEATSKAIGPMWYIRHDPSQWKEVRRLTGITKGQWKRFQYTVKQYAVFSGVRVLRTNKTAIKKLEVMAKHGKSPHLETLLKMVEARSEDA